MFTIKKMMNLRQMFSKISVLKAKRDISGYLPVLFIRFKGENKSVTIQIDVQIVLLIIPAKSFVVSYAKLPNYVQACTHY